MSSPLLSSTGGLCPPAGSVFFGDVATARKGIANGTDAHRRVLARVQQGKAKAEDYIFEMFFVASWTPMALLALGDTATLRELLAPHLSAG